jgi:Formyl transferase, C-terminal domain
VWGKYTCLVVHPGPHGDRGPSSLDWAIELGMDEWRVTVLEAVEETDAGDIWETSNVIKMRPVGKSSIYRHEVRHAAVEMLVMAVHNFARGEFKPLALNYGDPNVTGRLRPLIKQADRAIDWRSDSTAGVVRKIRAAEGHPGVLDAIAGAEFFLFNVHVERGLRGRPGEVIATRNGAICRATVDGAVWITHLKAKAGDAPFKLPATRALELSGIVPDVADVGVSRMRRAFTRQRMTELVSIALMLVSVPLAVSGVALLFAPSIGSFVAYLHLISSAWWTGLISWHLRRYMSASVRAAFSSRRPRARGGRSGASEGRAGSVPRSDPQPSRPA